MKKLLDWLFGSVIDTIITIVVILLFVGIATFVIKRYSKIQDSLRRDIASLTVNSELWRTKYNDLVITSAVKVQSISEAKNTSDSTIKKLVTENTKLGNKLKRTEYLLGLQMGIDIDTIVTTKTVYLNDTTFIEIDSLQINTLKIIRNKLSSNDTAKYHIEYKPELFVSINWYKDGKWRLRNIFIPRTRIYKVDVKANDDILKPSKLTVIKIERGS